MKRFISLVIVVLLLDLLLNNCANPVSPSGGPKDSIPPTLVESYPLNGQINFKDTEMEFAFTEYIDATQLKQKLIITPKTEAKYKFIVRKEKLTLKFEEPFNDSTTYNLNFASSVTDITEKNPVENFSVAFSTGNYIDSMSIDGIVYSLYDQKPAKQYLVGLYNYTDTLDIFKESPIYFTNTSDSGYFNLNYIKAGKYKLTAFKDENQNIILDPETEKHGFIAGIINLDSAIHLTKHIQTVLQNVKPIELIASRSVGPYIEVKYNKQIDNYTLKPEEYTSNIIGEKKDGLRIYKSNNVIYGDTLQFIIEASDSLKNITIDTLRNPFLDNTRKPTKYSVTTVLEEKILKDTNHIKILFNKPTYKTDSFRIELKKDSTFTIPSKYTLKWNNNLTEVHLTTVINKDSIVSLFKEAIKNDSIPDQETKEDINFNITYQIANASFYSIELDTSKVLSTNLNTYIKESYGTLKFNIDTGHDSIFTQLLDKNGNVAYSIKNDKNAVFGKVKPDNYTIRILIDNNNDGKWSPGNILARRQSPLQSCFGADAERRLRMR